MKFWSKQIEKDPNDLPTYLNLITVCAEGGDLAKAAELASEAETRFPNSPEVLIVRGAAQTVLGRSDQAVQDFAAAARLAPDRPDARFFLALMDYNQGKYSQAIDILKRADQDGLRDSDLHYLMAECLLKINLTNSDAALSELDQRSATESGFRRRQDPARPIASGKGAHQRSRHRPRIRSSRRSRLPKCNL